MHKLANNFMAARSASNETAARNPHTHRGISAGARSHARRPRACISTVPLRRKLRAALPSSLVGLVAFSFVVLAFGAAVYTAALPSLVAASPVVASVADSVSNAAEPTAVSDTQANDASGSDTTANVSPELTAGITSPDVSSLGLSGEGASSAVGPSATESSDTSSTENASDADQASDTPSNATSDADNGSSTTNDPNSQGDTTAEQAQNDAWLAENLPLATQGLDELHAQVEELNATMESDYLSAGASTRTACESDAARLYSTVGSERAKAVNSIAPRVYNGSPYETAANGVISAYRCLWDAAGIINVAWSDSQNVDDQARLESLLTEAREAEKNALDQYDSYRSALA